MGLRQSQKVGIFQPPQQGRSVEKGTKQPIWDTPRSGFVYKRGGGILDTHPPTQLWTHPDPPPLL